MCQAIRQHLIVTYMISLGLITACVSLLQPIPFASAQQLTGTVSQGTIGTGTQKKDAQTLSLKPHRLIRKPQNAPIASIEPSPSSSSPVSSIPAQPPSPASDNVTSQPTEPPSLYRSLGEAVPLATMSVAPSPATVTGSIAGGAKPTGTTPLAAAGASTASASGNRSAGGRSMSRLAAEMPGLAQLITPPSAPVVSIDPVIGTSPFSLSFTAQQGSGNPTAQTLSISNTGGGTLSWSASNSTTWLSLSSASGTGAGTVIVNVTTGTLTAGSYSGSVVLNATGASSVLVPVTFTVTAAPVPPAIGASPTNLSFTATQGGANPATQTLSISNTGGGTLNWTASETTPWLTVSPASGTGNGTITLSAVTGSLTVGSHTGAVTLSGGTGVTPVTVSVSFIITTAPVPPAIGASPTSFSFAATQGAANPTSQLLNISNPGGSTLTWSITDNQTWLTLNAISGTTTAETDPVTLSVNTNGLQAATHSATITVTATGASNTPQTIPVTLTLSAPATSSATLTWTPNTEPDLASYRVYQSTQQGVYGAAIATVPAVTASYTATGLPVGQTYYFTITAVDSSNNESPSSNEVNKPIP